MAQRVSTSFSASVGCSSCRIARTFVAIAGSGPSCSRGGSAFITRPLPEAVRCTDDRVRLARAERSEQNAEARRRGPVDARAHRNLTLAFDELCPDHDATTDLGRPRGLDLHTDRREPHDVAEGAIAEVDREHRTDRARTGAPIRRWLHAEASEGAMWHRSEGGQWSGDLPLLAPRPTTPAATTSTGWSAGKVAFDRRAHPSIAPRWRFMSSLRTRRLPSRQDARPDSRGVLAPFMACAMRRANRKDLARLKGVLEKAR